MKNTFLLLLAASCVDVNSVMGDNQTASDTHYSDLGL